jgi:SAM-dependent methyltransferase
VSDVCRSNSHDVFHHEWDISRSIGHLPEGATLSWTLDEVAHAGPEHLTRSYAESFDIKSDTDFEQVVDHLVSLGLDASSTVVDLGAGTGAFALAAAARCRRVIAVDVSFAMVDLLAARVADLGVSNVEVVRSGLLTYEHVGEPVDFVQSRNTLHQIPDFWKVMALRRIHGMLRPGGLLHLQDLVFSFPVDVTETAIESWLDHAVDDPARGWTAAEYATHLRDEYSTFTWLLEEMLDRTGFDIVDSWFSESGIYGSYDCRRRKDQGSDRSV